ncbi:MAG TPA: DNA repair protein RecN [bacterium]|nr:DNA repair protein RecN [bacterium]
MLRALQIRNFALIENAEIELGEGLNVLSGETGAGKSILIQALDLLLGGRGSSELIRQGEDESEVTGLFVRGADEVSLRRVISRSGKNRAYLNERPVPVSVLEQSGRELVDLAGQHEHQVLLDQDRHLTLLDEFAGFGADSALDRYRSEYAAYTSLAGQRRDLEAKARESREREEFLRFQLREIGEAAVRPGEEEALLQEKDVSKHAVRLREAGVRAEEALESGEDAVLQRVSRVAKDIRQASQLDGGLSETAARLDAALCELQDVARYLGAYGERVSCDPERLQAVEDRLALIARLKKKHGGTVEALLEKEKELRQGLALLDDFEGEASRIDAEIAAHEKKMLRLAREITQARQKAAGDLEVKIIRELKDLGMSSAKFTVSLKPLKSGAPAGGVFLGDRGADEGEFLVAPNMGEGMHPLAKIASGGELSRVFLAIKKVLGVVRGAETCVFDEVDSGIGGRIAEVVGRNLAEMARRRQVLCITHLPQIACYAAHHFMIRKETEKGRTHTKVQRLQTVQREEEIARMLAGVKVTDQAMAHAREMLKSAGNQQ